MPNTTTLSLNQIQELKLKLTINGKVKIGIDGSRNQRRVGREHIPIDWKFAADVGVEFMAWRGTIADYYSDKSFVPNMLAARDHGIERRLMYVVVNPWSNLAGHMKLIEQKLRELRAVEGDRVPVPVISLDVEIHKKNKLRSWTPREINQRAEQVRSEVVAMQDGQEPILYSYAAFILDKMGNPDYVRDMPVWIAWYLNSYERALTMLSPNRSARKPPSKRDLLLQEILNLGKIWQFSSEINRNGLGPAFGTDASHVDLNKTKLTDKQLDALFFWDKLPTQPPVDPSPPVDPPVIDLDQAYQRGYNDGNERGLEFGTQRTAIEIKHLIDINYPSEK